MNMSIQFIILYLSMFFWIFPAVRQYKTEMFWYFLVLALSDPISLILRALRINYPHTTLILYFALLLTVMLPLFKRPSTKAVLFIILTLSIYSFFDSVMFTANVKLLIHVIIIFYFSQRSLLFIKQTDKVNIFHLFLLLEEISIVLKVLAALDGTKTGLAFFVVTNGFQILIAIFFTIFKENDNRLFIDLKNI